MAAISRKAISLLIVCAAATCIAEAMECIGGAGTKKCQVAGDCRTGETCLNLYRGKSGKFNFGVCAAPQEEGCDCDPNNEDTCADNLVCKSTSCSPLGCKYKCVSVSAEEIVRCKVETVSPWRQVYKHDGSGNPLSGSLADLVAAVRNGAEVKIFGFYGTYTAQNVIVGANGLAVHAQFLFFMPYIGIPFGDKIFRYYFTQSTTGISQLSYYYPGYSFAERPFSNTQNYNYARGATWFVREAGISVGSAGPLVDAAIGQGASVRGVWQDTGRQLSAVSAGPSGLTGLLLWSLESANDGAEFTTDETFEVSSVNSAQITTASMLVQDVIVNVVTAPNDATWFADTCWTEVYSHDENGAGLSGSLGTLVLGALGGKPVRINIDGTLYETGLLRVANDGSGVIAQVYDSMDNDVTTPTWRWLEVSTDGSVIEFANQYAVDGATVITPGTSAITWYTKNEDWREIFTIGVNFDAAAFQAVLAEGADVRFMIDRNGYTEIRQADAVVNRGTDVLYNERELLFDGQGVYQKRNFLTTGGNFREKRYIIEGKNVQDDTSAVAARVFRNA